MAQAFWRIDEAGRINMHSAFASRKTVYPAFEKVYQRQEASSRETRYDIGASEAMICRVPSPVRN